MRRMLLVGAGMALGFLSLVARGESSAQPASPLFKYAVDTFGQPVSHRTTTQKWKGESFPTTVWRFQGATLTEASEPPETVRTTLLATHPLPDEKAARAALDAEARSKGWQCRIAWSAKPDVMPAKPDGTVTRIYWESGGGNCGANLIFQHGQLVGLGLHQAL